MSDGTPYVVECRPVAEALVDVELPREEGARAIRAIAGVASVHGVAVLWKAPGGCGLWVLALADGITPEVAAAVRDEVARGVDRFGVTASPVPQDEDDASA